jgi:type IV fimbrial biogenesis protein FimT
MFKNKKKNQSALVLIELVISLTILITFALLATATWQSIQEYQRIKSAASALFLDLSLAKSEAIKRNNRVRITFATGTDGNWCYGWKINAACDCFSQTSCSIDGTVLRQTKEKFPAIALESHVSSPGDRLTFESAKLFVANTFGHIRVKTSNKEVRVIVSRTGRIRLCSPSGEAHVAGYSSLC